MKQNEKILVYVVTGFLFVILAVAVIFGRDGTAKPQERQTAGAPVQGTAPGLEELLQSAKQLSGEASPPVPPVDLTSNVQLGPPAPAAELATLLGPSRHERDCRVVTARSGDTLGGLVERWCGGAAGCEGEAERLNEDMKTLHAGQEVWLPWVDDVEVLAGYREHPQKHGSEKASGSGKTAAVPGSSKHSAGAAVPAVGHGKGDAAAGFRTYVVKPGDKLWAIAEHEVGKAKARAFLQRVRELNPELDVNHLKVAQSIKLPANT